TRPATTEAAVARPFRLLKPTTATTSSGAGRAPPKGAESDNAGAGGIALDRARSGGGAASPSPFAAFEVAQEDNAIPTTAHTTIARTAGLPVWGRRTRYHSVPLRAAGERVDRSRPPPYRAPKAQTHTRKGKSMSGEAT